MKTPALLIASLLLPLGFASGQTPVIDAAAISAIESLKTASGTAMTTANLALEKLVRMAGDYGTGSGTKFPDDIRRMRDALTGDDDGLVKKIEKLGSDSGATSAKIVIADCGHTPYIEKPAEFAAVLNEQLVTK